MAVECERPSDCETPPSEPTPEEGSQEKKLAPGDYIVQNYHQLVRSLGGTSHAHQAVSQAWLRVHNRPPESIRNVGGYVYTVIQRILWEESQQPRNTVSLGDLDPIAFQERAYDTVDKGDIQRALKSLPELDRTVFSMNAEDGKPARQIADELGIPRKRAEYILTRARHTLKSLLSEPSQG